ncbi:MAG: asparagine synthase (glutamine-hydrolyzing) [Gemmatimonadales bacterium]
MCGLAGIISDDPSVAGRVPAMLATIRHRGPDDEGLECLGPATLGHRRLSILDLAGGRQPMRTADGTLAVVFNGEIYNFPALRAAFEAEGRRFRTRSDTEILLHLYEKYGVDCVRHLDGMFAFALWDAARRRLLLARDHLGQKPLFYAETARGLVFASEVKAVLASGLVTREIDLEALFHYVSLRFIPDQLTLFKGVRKLPAAHRLVYEQGVVRVERYWSFSSVEKRAGSDAELTDALDHELRETVRAHLLSDVPVGSFLSGGIDSSLITALMADVSPDPVSTFSIGVREQGFNELPFAAQVARQYHTRHHEEVVTADLVRLVPEMVWHLDEPSDPFGAGVYLVARLAAREVKVVLSGDGGDELFAGYDRFAGQRLATMYGLLPRSLRRTVFRQLIGLVPETFGYKSLAQKLHWLNEMSLLDGGERYAASMSFLRFTEDAKRSLFTPDARVGLAGLDSTDKILAHFNSANARELIDRMLYTDLMTRIPDHLLPIVDRMAMAHGLEVRPPLLEHRMVEFAAALPADLKLRGTKLKYILRRVAARYLPPDLVERPKQGFGFPLARWMRTDLRHLLRQVAAESRLVQAGVFNRAYVERLVAEHLEGRRDHNFRLWILLNLEVWHRLFLEEQSLEEVADWIERYRAGPQGGPATLLSA